MLQKILSLNGIFAVYKPKGETSATTVSRVKEAILSNLPKEKRKQAGRSLKVGHGGTLDPMATGVLVIGLGSGCKALSTFLSGSKGYKATGKFGSSFDTLDCTGKLLEERAPVDLVSQEAFQAILDEKFTGTILQRPPAFSAVHVNGKRAHELARAHRSDPQGAPLELPARSITIDSVTVTAWSPPEFQLEMVCGGGTYVRSLIVDAASEVGQLAAMYALERVKQGRFGLEECVQVDSCADLDLIASVLHDTTKIAVAESKLES